MLKLGYVCQFFTKEYGGPVTNLMYALSDKIHVINYSFIGKHMQYYRGGRHLKAYEGVKRCFRIRRYDVYFRVSGVLFPKKLSELLGEDMLDIVQSEEYYQPASHIAYEFCRRRNIPFIINHRCSEDRVRTLRERLFFSLANPLSKRVVRGCSAIVCLSEAGKKSILKVFPDASDKVHVIPNSICPQDYSGADGVKFRKKYNISSKAPLVLCVGRLHPQKRIDLLVRAFSDVKKKSPKAVLCVVGPIFEDELKKILSVVRDLGVDDVLFTGSIQNNEIKHAYAAANVCVMSSEFEPFGYSLLEAMCLKKPQVAFDIGAISEIIEDGVSGYVVPFPKTKEFGERILEILNDKKKAQNMGFSGFQIVKQNFSLDKNMKIMIELYNSVSNIK
jgi:glycosyltransferase involved in cell wall biosynthesis